LICYFDQRNRLAGQMKGDFHLTLFCIHPFRRMQQCELAGLFRRGDLPAGYLEAAPLLRLGSGIRLARRGSGSGLVSCGTSAIASPSCTSAVLSKWGRPAKSMLRRSTPTRVHCWIAFPSSCSTSRAPLPSSQFRASCPHRSRHRRVAIFTCVVPTRRRDAERIFPRCCRLMGQAQSPAIFRDCPAAVRCIQPMAWSYSVARPLTSRRDPPVSAMCCSSADGFQRAP